MNIEHISVSRANVWAICQLQYKFKYHLRIPVDKPEPPYFIFGKLVHKIIEEYTVNHGKRTIKEIQQDCLSGNILLDKGQKYIPSRVLPKDYLAKLPKHLRAFNKLDRKLSVQGECEWEFKYDLDPPHKKYVYGFIDRLIYSKNNALILDFKTTKKGPWRRTKKDIVMDPQLQCYALMVWKKLGIDPSNIRAALYYLDGEDLVGSIFTKETLETVHQKLLETYNDIQNTSPEQAKGYVGKHCDRCDYRDMCPLYSLTR